MKKLLFVFAAVALLLGSTLGVAHAQGGTNPTFTDLSGNWLGVTQFGRPVFDSTTTVQMTQDAKGNIGGTFCISQFVNSVPAITCSPLRGKWTDQFHFQLNFSEGQETGVVVGPVACSDGTTGLWISGSEQNSGATGTFSYTTCSVYPFN